MKPITNLIGITGLKGHGKDTVGDMLMRRFNNFRRDSFAAPMRMLANDLFGITHETYNEPIEGLNMTGRQFLQKLGTEVGRSLSPDLWIHALAYRWNQQFSIPKTGIKQKYAGLIITDLRFPNEAKFIKDNGGCILHVIRPGFGEQDSHVSEAGIPSALIDFSICNTGDLENLEVIVADFYNWFVQNLPSGRIIQPEALLVK